MKIISIVAVLASFIVGVIALPYLPDDIFIHWDAQGNPDLQVNKYIGVLIFPLLMIITLFIHQLLIRMNSQQSLNSSIFIVTMLIFYLIIQALLILINLDVLQFHIEIAGIIVGIFIMILAPPMRYVKMNTLYGIRTPWSMKNEVSWTRSNRFGANLMFLWGAFTIFASFLLPSKYVMPVVLSVGLVVVIVIVYASYRFYKESI